MSSMNEIYRFPIVVTRCTSHYQFTQTKRHIPLQSRGDRSAVQSRMHVFGEDLCIKSQSIEARIVAVLYKRSSIWRTRFECSYHPTR